LGARFRHAQRGILAARAARPGVAGVLDKYGTRTFQGRAGACRTYAEQGVPLTERAAFGLALAQCHRAGAVGFRQLLHVSRSRFRAAWYINGKQPKAGQIFRNPDLAKAFRLLQAQGRDAL